MRFFWMLTIAVAACEPQAQAPKSAGPLQSRPAESAALGAVRTLNSTGLRAEVLERPVSKARLNIVTPAFAETVTVPAPRLYEVQLEVAGDDTDGAAIELGLDAERPRRLSSSQSAIGLGELLPAGSELSLGEHWLFAARVAASGIVLLSDSGAPLAMARPFFVGSGARPARRERAHAWVCRPDGTYNGPSGTRVLFDALLFSAQGVPLDSPLRLLLRGPQQTGELGLRWPIALLDVPSGDYEVQLFAPAISPVSVRFTVNRELAQVP